MRFMKMLEGIMIKDEVLEKENMEIKSKFLEYEYITGK